MLMALQERLKQESADQIKELTASRDEGTMTVIQVAPVVAGFSFTPSRDVLPKSNHYHVLNLDSRHHDLQSTDYPVPFQ
jgi:hypothetical protein